MKYGFGIIGTGFIAKHHAKALSAVSNAYVAAVCSRDEKRAVAFASEYNCIPYTDLHRMLSDSNVSIVSVCTPSGTHLDYAVASAESRRHVIVEKPLEITLRRCDIMINAAQKYGVYLGGVFQSRYFDASQVVKKAINDGRFGTMVLGDAYVKWLRSQEYYNIGVWKGTQKLDGGGALMNQSIHAIDLLQWYMGPVESVCGYVGIVGHKNIEVEDNAVAALQFTNGACGIIEGSTAVYPGFLKRIEILGTTGTAVLEEENLKIWRFAEETSEDNEIRNKYSNVTKTGGGVADPTAIGTEGHRRQFVDFIQAIEAKKPYLLDGIEARKSVAIILAIYESSRTGRKISVPS
jgi:UDP-N-acetyl-2-amino-2-deoxyglucuronate dehydrogenase